MLLLFYQGINSISLGGKLMPEKRAEWADARFEIEVSDYELEQERQEQEEFEQWMLEHADDYWE